MPIYVTFKRSLVRQKFYLLKIRAQKAKSDRYNRRVKSSESYFDESTLPLVTFQMYLLVNLQYATVKKAALNFQLVTSSSLVCMIKLLILTSSIWE